MRDKGEILFNGLIFFASIFLFNSSRSFPRFQTADKLGPAFWPQILLITIILLTGVLVVRNLRHFIKPKAVTTAISDKTKTYAPYTLLTVISTSLIFSFAVEYLGFLISIFVYQLLLLYILRVRSALTLIAFPLGMTFTLYFIFLSLLSIPLPRGEGIFMDFSRIFY